MVQGPENNQNKKTSAAKKRKLLLVEIEEQRVSFFTFLYLVQ